MPSNGVGPAAQQAAIPPNSRNLRRGMMALSLSVLSFTMGLQGGRFTSEEEGSTLLMTCIIALAAGLSPALERLKAMYHNTNKERHDPVHKRAAAGMFLLLVPTALTFGLLGPSGLVTIASLTMAVHSLRGY